MNTAEETKTTLLDARYSDHFDLSGTMYELGSPKYFLYLSQENVQQPLLELFDEQEKTAPGFCNIASII